MKFPFPLALAVAFAALSQTALAQPAAGAASAAHAQPAAKAGSASDTHRGAPAAPAPVTRAEAQDDGRLPGDQRIEKLHHADSGSTLDETRVGGESQGVTVKPHNRAPAYEIRPDSNRSQKDGGQRVWNVLKF